MSLKVGQKFKSLVSDDIFEVVSNRAQEEFCLKTIKYLSMGRALPVDREGNYELYYGIKIKLIDPRKPIVQLEVGKHYLDDRGREWVVTYSHGNIADTYECNLIGSYMVRNTIARDGTGGYNGNKDFSLVKEVLRT